VCQASWSANLTLSARWRFVLLLDVGGLTGSSSKRVNFHNLFSTSWSLTVSAKSTSVSMMSPLACLRNLRLVFDVEEFAVSSAGGPLACAQL
jgi:hypothetical protein